MDAFADGHDVVACALLWRRDGAQEWQRKPMRALGNDRWSGGFVVDAMGRWQYTIQAWVDPFLSWRHDYMRRIDPDDVRIAALTGAQLIEAAARRAGKGAIRQVAHRLGQEARQRPPGPRPRRPTS